MASSLFAPAVDLLVQYASYHRDRRNIASHFIGIPLIVLAIGVLLARLPMGPTTAAWVAWAASSVWYLGRGALLPGAATVLVNGLLVGLGHPLAQGSTGDWLAWGVGLFVLGWVIQFVGHWWEGRKPAFVDDVIGLLVGPMFVVCEWLFATGACRDLAQEIERRAGPVRTGHDSTPAA